MFFFTLVKRKKSHGIDRFYVCSDMQYAGLGERLPLWFTSMST